MYHLTTPQQNIWNLQKTFPETSISNLCGAVFWERKIDVEIVRKALNKFIELQAGMRLQFEEKNGETCQYTAEYAEQAFPCLSFDGHTSFERYAQEFAQTPFEMKNSPMYHFVIFELNGTSGVLACLNHLIADAWTFSLLAKGVWNHCLEFESGSVSEHETYDYVDYIETEQKYLESERCQKDMEYWTEVYAEKPDLCPIKLISTPVTMPTAQRFTTILTAEQTAKINTFCSENSVSQAVLFETAVFVYLSKVNRENKRITIGVPVLNRKTRNDKSTVGMYISTTPLTIDISAEDSASVLSERITEAHSRLFRHQKYPYSNILTEVRKKHQFEGNLYDVIVSFQNAKTDEDITTKWFSNGFSEIPFSLHIDNRDSADSYTLNVDYQTEVFRHPEEISMLVDRLMLIINQIIDNQLITVGEINIIPEDEYQKVIFDFNDTAVEYPRDKCIHELFGEQAARTPNRTALIFEDKKFTYKQLDEMSNSLAHYLREEKGIKPNDIVPIISKRSWHVVVAMLGVLKAGGAYMPVDPSYPADRIEYMLTEVGAETALVCGYTESLSIQALDLEAFDYDSHHTVITNVNYAEDKCYVLFTSGTTGKPKAAIVTHHNLGNFVNNNNNNLYQCNMLNTCKVVLATGTFTFDISVFEIYLSLLNGLTVVMASETENLSASMLSELIVKYDVDVIHSTPTKIAMFFDDEVFQRASVHLKMMMVGAETFTEELRNKVKQYTDAVIYNGYGPTETTIAVSFKRITEHTCCIHDLFTRQAAMTPDKIALVFEDKQFTYRQLDEMSNSLAHYLLENGIKTKDIIGVHCNRSELVIIAQLATLKLGCAFLPIDKRYPIERVQGLIIDCNVAVLLTDSDNKYDCYNVRQINIVEGLSSSIERIDIECKLDDTCYVIYTSGSTGKPKGCLLTFRGVTNFCKNNNLIPYCKKLLKQIVVSVNTISFDYFIAETLLPLSNGYTVVLANENQSNSKEEFKRLVLKNGVNMIMTTPTRLSIYTENESENGYLNNIDIIVSSGEALSPELLSLLNKICNAKIFNPLGPSECSVWNTDGNFKNNKKSYKPCIHELFEEQARNTPDKIALVFEDKKFTYKQLDEMSNSLANYLREEKEIKPNDIVPIIAKRSWHIIVAMLGVLKAGGAYMPVSPSYPVDRINYMTSEAGSKYALTFGYANEIGIEKVELETFNYLFQIEQIENVNTPNDLCYLIFTSGSTGKPKATMLTHATVRNYSHANTKNAVCHNILRSSCDSIVSVTNIVFDIFVTESILPILHGLTIYLASDEEVFSQSKLADLIAGNPIDVMQTTPTKMRSYMLEEDNLSYLSKLKMIILGGEALSPELYQEIQKYTEARIYNIYGPAETTVWSTNSHVESVDITIGKPIANTQIYILDQNRNPLPIGVAGELCISGDGVGKGYLNRPELTAEKFIPNPFIEGKTMYCTGDLARWRVDGELEYLGRIDTQVKIRGLRIELGEIESVMSSFDGIRLTAVTDKRDENNRQYLVGYYTADKTIDEKALRQHLAAKLPKYMVPNYFVHLEEMPMTASGKTDRKNLPLPDFTVLTNEYVAPETETEKAIAAIWSKLLKVENVGKTDDFYDLGGDSLMAISLLNHLENAFGTEITMKDILEHPVLESLAKRIESSERKTQKIFATGSDRYTLLPQQKAIYAVCSKNLDTLTYNMPTRIPLDESIDREKIKKCFIQLVQNHSSLRTYISAEADDVFGIADNDAYLTFEEYSDGNYMDFVRPFDLSKAPLMRIGFTETAMLFDMHHIIADGESLNLILHDLTKLYFDEETAVNDVQYADYAAYFKEADFSEHKTFYKDMLRCDFEPTVLPERKHQGEAVGISKMYQLDSKAFEHAKKYAKAMGLTETMLFLGVYGILLSKYTAKSEVLSSIVLTNRIHRETQDIVGMFVNTLPVMMKADGTVSEYFANVKQLVLNLFAYQELPFFDAAEAVGMTDKSVINTSFVYQADGEKKLSIGSAKLSSEFIDTHTSKFDLTFEMTPNENGCTVRIEYNSGKYEEALIDRLFTAFGRILNQLEKEKITDISVLSEDEYQKVIFDFNDTAVEYPRDKCVHELFSEQAARTPEKIALVFQDKKFTYKQLDEMSNSLANYLREEKNIQPNDIVPIIAKRSWHIIVAMLGILKAGGAYMPVDPAYPLDRISFMLEEANAKIALTFGYEGELGIKSMELETFDFGRETEAIENRNISDNLCYLITTSGSTGKPKATMLTHSAVRNYSDNNLKNIVFHNILNKQQKKIVSVTNFVFDIFATESILPILHGLTIYFASDDEVVSQEKLAALIQNNAIDVMQTTPTKMRGYMLDKANLVYLQKLKTIILGGEALTSDLYQELTEYTDAEIYNIYGPAETTVWSTNSHVENIDITIGKPIANTQIYILDQNRNPLPIGVAGELCISGDGVGKGYLNRPELTAEKFIPNPFYDEKTNPSAGKIMYCTGDLARWRVDGELEYLGRIDTQVKIRGLRIELGEIESVMSSFEGIRLTAVTDKRDENNRQYLVGYYTADKAIDEKAMRQHLSAKLPKYMVPNYFVHLEEMPMTASGKTDRKNLPLPDFSASKEEYVTPETETEIKLCNLIAQLLGMEKVGVTDDFFDIGGDSLKAIEYIAKAHNIGIEIGLQDVFDYPTVRELCEHFTHGSETEILYKQEDFEKYQKLLRKNVLNDNFVLEKKSLGNVLLTGATGFLGAHVLAAFLREESGKIYCLVRNSAEKLTETLHYYFDSKYNDEIGKRIIPIVGDITNPDLSSDIPDDVQTVIHTAASVKHYGSYQYFHDINVQGTQNVIDYAKQIGAKLIHISTISVSGNSFADAFTVYRSEEEKHFDEQSLFIEQELDNVYVRSKFEAEMAVLDAALEGLDAKIIRVGNLTNRASDFKFQPNYSQNAFLTRIKAALEFGKLPEYLMPLYAEFSPIDETAEGVIRIAQYAKEQNVFHLNSNRPIYFTRLLEVLKALEIPMEVVSGTEFGRLLQEYAKHSETEYIYEAFQNDMDENGTLVYDSNIRIINDFTVQFLKCVGFEWSQIDFEYIKGYVKYFRDLGYLEV